MKKYRYGIHARMMFEDCETSATLSWKSPVQLHAGHAIYVGPFGEKLVITEVIWDLFAKRYASVHTKPMVFSEPFEEWKERIERAGFVTY